MEVELGALPGGLRDRAASSAAETLQASLDLSRPPLLQMALFRHGGTAKDELLLVFHHLVVDGVSWRLLLEDLEVVCSQLGAGEAVSLRPKPTSYPSWAERLAEHARSPRARQEVDFWQLRKAPAPLGVDLETGVNSVATARRVEVAMSAEDTRVLLEVVPQAYHTRINDVLLTALVEAFADGLGSRRLLIDLEGHGRDELFEDLDVSQTVGWFTAIYPVLLDLEAVPAPFSERPGEALKAIKEQLRAIPGQGLGYGLLRYLGAEETAAALRAQPQPQVAFNYLGQLDQGLADSRLLQPAGKPPGALRDGRQPRRHLLEIDGAVVGARLRFTWTYSENRHRRATVEGLARRFVAALRKLAEHCLSPDAGGWTPSDFPLANLDQPALDRLTAPANGPIEDLYPLSALQLGMLFHTLDAPRTGIYVEQVSVSFDHALNVEAFRRAWQRLAERHPILRTAFAWQDLAEPLQLVYRGVSLPWQMLDWRGLEPREQHTKLRAYLDQDRHDGFDLSTAPILRLALIRLGERRYRFVWSHHHILLDGWSIQPLWRELIVFYSAVSRGQEPKLERIRPYRDYIAWLERQDLGAAEQFWRRTLEGFAAPNALGIARQSAARHAEALEPGEVREGAPVAGSASETRQRKLKRATTEKLTTFARRHRFTLNTVVQGAWALVVAHLSGDRDVVYGTVNSGRSAPLPGIEKMLGLFINTLPTRLPVRPRADLVSWLERLQALQAEIRQYEYTPLSRVQAWSEVPAGQPLFESIVAFENYPVDLLVEQKSAEGLRVGEVESLEQTNFPINLMVLPGAGLGLRILYNRYRLDAPDTERILRYLENLLEAVAGEAASSLGALPLVTRAERHQLVAEWNDTEAPLSDRRLEELFALRAAERPEAPAIYFPRHDPLSYGELDRSANRLAQQLSALELRPGERVAVLLERSPEMVVALLGILKAGGVYVPLEKRFPAARMNWILANMEVRVLALDAAHLERAAELVPELPLLENVICLDEPPRRAARLQGARLWRPRDLAARPATATPRRLGAEAAAYIIFTSGSTGVPKGVMVRHRPAVNLIEWVNRTFGVGEADQVLFVTSLGFDLSVYDVFGLLAAGGSIRVAAREELEDPAALVRILEGEDVTFWDSAPAALQQLVPLLSGSRQSGRQCVAPGFLKR